MNEQKQSFKTILILNAVIMLIYSSTVRWHIFMSTNRLLVVIAVYALMLIVLPFVAYKSKHVAQVVVSAYHTCRDSIRRTIHNWKKIVRVIIIFVLTALIDIVGVKMYEFVTKQTVNLMIIYLVIGLSYLAVTVFLLRKELAQKPEKLFFCCSMIIGTTLIAASPNVNGLTWDDDTHYLRVESIANFADEAGYRADDLLMQDYAAVALEHAHYTSAERVTFDQQLNESFARRETGILRSDCGIYSICYIHEAAAVVLGRALHLPFTWIWSFAKFCNLLLYSCIVVLAMKKLQYGKIFAASMSLIPTMVYMAGNYSYDPWIAGFMMYGFCYFFHFLQNRDQKIKKKDIFLMLGAFILGILPKAIYFVIMFPLFLMPKMTFETKKEHRKYLFWLLMTGLFLAATFVVPMVFHGAGSGDTRGGTDVNSTAQIQYILANPGTFLSMMINFLGMYLSPLNAGEFTTKFAYFGDGFFARQLPIVLLFIVAILDRNGVKNKDFPVIFVTIISFLVTVFLVAMALYIMFTPVGYNTVLGCQYRYLIPLLFPLMYMIFPDVTKNKINKAWFNSVPMLLMSVIFLVNTMGLVANYY